MLHGTLLASAGLAPCFDAGRCLPRAETLGRTSGHPFVVLRDAAWSRLISSALPSRPRRTETDSSDVPVTGPRRPRSRVPSIDRYRAHLPSAVKASGHDSCFSRRSRPLQHGRGAVLAASSLATAPLLACAIGEGPPLARPRPRELAVRLEEDRAHASLGQATPADFCNTTRRTGTPCERSILVRELREAGASLLTAACATAPNPRCWFPSDEPRELRRLSPPRQRGPRVPERRALPFTGELSSSNLSLEHPGRRISAGEGLETPSSSEDTAEVPFRRRPAKGDGFRKTEVLSSAPEPIEPPLSRRHDDLGCAARLLPRTTPRIGPVSRRPSRFRGFTGHCSRGSRLLLRRLSAPRPDEPSAVQRVGRSLCLRSSRR